MRPTYSAPEPLVIWGRLDAAVKHIAKQVRHIPEASHDYHGTLKTIHSAAASLTEGVEELLAAYYSSKFERESPLTEPAAEEVIDGHFADVDDEPQPAKADPEPEPAAPAPDPKPAAVKRRQPQTIRVPIDVRAAERNGQPVSVRERILTMVRRGPQSSAYMMQELVRNGYDVTEADVDRTCLAMAGAMGISLVTTASGNRWKVSE